MNANVQFQMRLPREMKDWIAAQAAANVSSQNSEIIRSIRERMERTEGHRVRVFNRPEPAQSFLRISNIKW